MLRVNLIVFLCIFLFGSSALAQIPQAPSNIDFATINVDDLTDQQLITLLQQAQASGYTVDNIVQQAEAKGMSAANASKLRDRLSNLVASNPSLGGNPNARPGNAPTGAQGRLSEPVNPAERLQESRMQAIRARIFGADLFSNTNLSFEPNLTIPTPAGYVIGAGDQIVVDVFGYSEKHDKLTVNPDGYINIPNVGPVLVSGLTIEDARTRITNRLSSIYGGIKTGETHVQVLLGDIRSIRVMVIGEVVRPGSYTLPSLATVGNALYASGGPGENGSFRNITLLRGGQVIDTFDLYHFLTYGSLKGNVLLHDQDVIKVNPYDKRIVLDGQVKHPGIFEVKENETLGDLIRYSGGYTDRAYTDEIKATRETEKQKEALTIRGDQTNSFTLRTGDSLYVDSVLNRLTNKVTVMGEVYFPGTYALKPGMTVKDLISIAGGVRDDVFLSRGLISRRTADYMPEALSFNVGNVLSGSASIPVQTADTVRIYSKSEIHEPYYIYVAGEVNRPDSVPFADGLRLLDAILLVGGFKDAASWKEIEVARRTRSQEYNADDLSRAIVRKFSVPGNFDPMDDTSSNFILEPFDLITIRRAPGYSAQDAAKVEGEVAYPGPYVIDSKEEKLSDLIRKTGGLKKNAYVEGALLLRRKNRTEAEKILEQNKLELFREANKSDDSVEFKRLIVNQQSDYQLVDIDLGKALASPGSKYDLLVQKDDIVRVPPRLETVTLNGEIFYPKQIRFDSQYSFADYINQAGGYTTNALKKRAYILYPNGQVKANKKILFFNHYPKVKPGSEIFVPAKKKKSGTSTAEILGITTGLAALMGIILSIITITK